MMKRMGRNNPRTGASWGHAAVQAVARPALRNPCPWYGGVVGKYGEEEGVAGLGEWCPHPSYGGVAERYGEEAVEGSVQR